MKTPLTLAALISAILTTSACQAGVLYTTTDLGTGYQFESNAVGQVYGVANSTGSVVYAFDKSPVAAIDLGPTYFGAGQFQVLTLKIGTHQVGDRVGIQMSLERAILFDPVSQDRIDVPPSAFQPRSR